MCLISAGLLAPAPWSTYVEHSIHRTARATLAAGAEADESQDWVYVFQFSLPLGRAALAATRSNATLVDFLLSHQPRKPDGARAPHPCTALRALAKNKRRARRQNARRLRERCTPFEHSAGRKEQNPELKVPVSWRQMCARKSCTRAWSASATSTRPTFTTCPSPTRTRCGAHGAWPPARGACAHRPGAAAARSLCCHQDASRASLTAST